MQQIKIDFDNPGLPQHLDAMEGDAQSRFFQATLYRSGAAYTPPADAAYSIMYSGFGPQNQGWYDTINDGAGKRAACAVSGNVVTCEIDRHALIVPGHVSIVLCVTTGKGYMLKSRPILIDARNDNYDDTVEVESYFYITSVTNTIWAQAIQAALELKNIIDTTLTIEGKAADAAATGKRIEAESKRIDVLNEGGLNLKNDVIDTSVKQWLTDHPEATTTVQNHSLDVAKMIIGTLGYVLPEMYGAKGDGVTDDTAAINAAFDSGYVVFFLEKTYLIDGEISIEITDGIVYGNNATLKIKPNSAQSYSGLICHGSCVIRDLTIVGERNNHDGTDGEWGMCLSANDVHDCVFDNITCIDGFGDGLYIGNSDDNAPFDNRNITVRNCFFNNNRRNNISIIHGKNIVIESCYIGHANGTNPQIGIDVEPNTEYQHADVVVQNCTFENNIFGDVETASKNAKCFVLNSVSINDECQEGSDFSSYGGELKVYGCFIRYAKRAVFFASGAEAQLDALNNVVRNTATIADNSSYDSIIYAKNGTLTLDGLTCSIGKNTKLLYAFQDTGTCVVDIKNIYSSDNISAYHDCTFTAENVPPINISVGEFTINASNWWPAYQYTRDDSDQTFEISTNIPSNIVFVPKDRRVINLTGDYITYNGSVGERIELYKCNGKYFVVK